ncbi:phospholipase D/Transphosphatidylase [Candidatus Magnetoovum chiemensis]|nr:phospholipase D/Transphosphatidylase [Candidatus Magnetoovum chiemensis]
MAQEEESTMFQEKDQEEAAETYCHPSYKWIGQRQFVENAQLWNVSLYSGGIGFAFLNYSDSKALRVILNVYREEQGIVEHFITNAYQCGDWGNNWQKWQAHQFPIYPYESLHGRASFMTFSYIIHKDGKSIPSKYEYKFASIDDFHRGCLSNDDFNDSWFRRDNKYKTYDIKKEYLQNALYKINHTYESLPISPFFTRGNTWDVFHPIHEIHRNIDWVIKRKEDDPEGHHYIKMAVFDFEYTHIANHLIHAKEKGVDIECFAEWSSVSTKNVVENIARMRRAGIPIYGVVRNNPSDTSHGIASMHTKIIIFDGEIVHSSSYNLHFHLWGGNWENGLVYYSKDFAALYANIYYAIAGAVIQRLDIEPEGRYNALYSFGSYSTPRRDYYRPQDAIITEINSAKHDIVVSMFDIGYLTGVSYYDNHETDVITALINARNRGVRVRIIVNGMITHTGALPQAWDKSAWRPLKEPLRHLKESWMEVYFVYYQESIYSPLHHKFAVFDNYTVITESYNWYVASLYSDEVLSVVRDEVIARTFLEEADKIFQTFRIGHE